LKISRAAQMVAGQKTRNGYVVREESLKRDYEEREINQNPLFKGRTKLKSAQDFRKGGKPVLPAVWKFSMEALVTRHNGAHLSDWASSHYLCMIAFLRA